MVKFHFDEITKHLSIIAHHHSKLYKTLGRNDRINKDAKTVIKEFVEFTYYADLYIKEIVKNERAKVENLIKFFNFGFAYKDNSFNFVQDDIRELMKLLLQILMESYEEYNYLRTGIAISTAHIHDINQGLCSSGYSNDISIERTFGDELTQDRYPYFMTLFSTDNELKRFKKTLTVAKNVRCSVISYHSLFFYYHAINNYYESKNQSNKLKLDYQYIESIDSTLNNFVRFLKETTNTNYFSFLLNKVSVKVKINCAYNIDKKDCFIEAWDPKVILQYIYYVRFYYFMLMLHFS